MFDVGDGVLLLGFHGKASTLGVGVVELAQAALQRLEGSAEMVGMVIGNQGRMFSAGANIDPQALLAGGETPAVAVERMGRAFQDLLQGMRYCPKPVVAAPFDRTLGGGTEVVLAAARIVAHIELYMGLVEVGVGLVPAGGGCKEMLRRVMNPAMAIPNTDPIPVMQRIFETIGMAKVSVGAIEAREMGYLQPADRVVMDRERLLGEAKREVLHMAHSGHVPPRPEKIYAGGRDMLAALRSALYQMREGEYISGHDRLIGEKLGWILTGGDISAPEWVDEQYILDLERAAFVELIQTGKTMERVLHTLKTGKPLRN
jgi:3-hydroxyacyl-CoA dehydrogenase